MYRWLLFKRKEILFYGERGYKGKKYVVDEDESCTLSTFVFSSFFLDAWKFYKNSFSYKKYAEFFFYYGSMEREERF